MTTVADHALILPILLPFAAAIVLLSGQTADALIWQRRLSLAATAVLLPLAALLLLFSTDGVDRFLSLIHI